MRAAVFPNRRRHHLASLFVTLTLLASVLAAVDSAKVLVITSNLSNSLVIASGHIADVLVAAGHDVVSNRSLRSPLLDAACRRFSSTKCERAFASSTARSSRASFECARSPAVGTSKCRSTSIRSSSSKPRGGGDAPSTRRCWRRAKVRSSFRF